MICKNGTRDFVEVRGGYGDIHHFSCARRITCNDHVRGAATTVLVDGSNYIFRAFFALPPLNNSRGTDQRRVRLHPDVPQAHQGATSELYRCDFRARPSGPFATTCSPNTRPMAPETPNDLQVQIPYIYRVIDAFRIKRIVREGYEADDVIATLATAGVQEENRFGASSPPTRISCRWWGPMCGYGIRCAINRRGVQRGARPFRRRAQNPHRYPGVDGRIRSTILRECARHRRKNRDRADPGIRRASTICMPTSPRWRNRRRFAARRKSRACWPSIVTTRCWRASW